jgi:hypothetical protein
MRAQSAALGIAAAAALSSTAPALPCAMTAPGELTISEFTCTISEGPSISPARDEQADTGSAGMTQSGSPLSAGPQSTLLLELIPPDEVADIFADRGIDYQPASDNDLEQIRRGALASRRGGGPGRGSDDVLSGLFVDQDAAAHSEAKSGRRRVSHAPETGPEGIGEVVRQPRVSANAALGRCPPAEEGIWVHGASSSSG